MSLLPPHRSRRRAFTLVELMVVLALIGVVTAMILPEMRGTFEGALLRSTSRTLVDVLQLAASRAISLRQVHRVQLDAAKGRYVIERRVRGRGPERFEPATGVPGSAGPLDPRISFQVHARDEEPADPGDAVNGPGGPPSERGDPELTTVSFQPDGTAEAKEIVLRDRAGFRLALRINPITAQVQVVELDRS